MLTACTFGNSFTSFIVFQIIKNLFQKYNLYAQKKNVSIILKNDWQDWSNIFTNSFHYISFFFNLFLLFIYLFF